MAHNSHYNRKMVKATREGGNTVAVTQSWRAASPELVEQMRQLLPHQVEDWATEWRQRNLPLQEFLRALWRFASMPRIRENERILYERVDAGLIILSLSVLPSDSSWAAAVRLMQRLLVMLGGDSIPEPRPSNVAGNLHDAWYQGHMDQAEARTVQLVRQAGIRGLLVQLMAPSAPATVPSTLPSLWRVSTRMVQRWSGQDLVLGFRLATRAQASWVSNRHRLQVLTPESEQARYRTWNDTAYVVDLIREMRPMAALGDVLACYQPHLAGALLARIAQGAAGLSNRRLASLLVEVSAVTVATTPAMDADQVSRHLLAIMDWLHLSRYAPSETDERIAIWTAWGWFLAVALAFLSPDGAIAGAVPVEPIDDDCALWGALQTGNADEAVAQAWAFGDVAEVWHAIIDEAAVIAAPDTLRMVWAYKPWLSDAAFGVPLLPAVVRIMSQMRPALVIRGGV